MFRRLVGDNMINKQCVNETYLKRLDKYKKIKTNDNICEYCHLDCDDYIYPLDKNSHLFLYLNEGEWHLNIKYAKNKIIVPINYCPVCGRELYK